SPVCVLVGVDHFRYASGTTAFSQLTFVTYLWSHSLVMAVVWGVLLAAIGRWRTAAPVSGLLIALVVSHWVLDVASHAPDMPLWPGSSSPKLGLGLWYSMPLTLIVEGAMWLACLARY